MAALMFFIAQGNSMIITDLFADKSVTLVDDNCPAPAEERNDSNNNPGEEDHFHYSLFEFNMLDELEMSFHFQNTVLYPSLLQSVITPPPEFS